MKRFLIAAALIVTAICATALSQTSSNQTSAAAGIDSEVRKLHDEFLAAGRSNDPAVLERILANNFSAQGVPPPTPPRSKADWIADIKSGEVKIESFKVGDVTFKSYGSTVVSTEDVKYKTKWRNLEYSFWQRIFLVYAKAERWQILTLIAIDFRD